MEVESSWLCGFLLESEVHSLMTAVVFDGLLTTGLFKRAFIDHADNYAVLEAW